MTPIFVSVQTSAFSGATLLSFLLGAHPQIATVGEMNGLIEREDPETYRCSCGQRIKECGFWRQVGDEMRRRGFAFDVTHFDTAFALGGSQMLQRLRATSFGSPLLDSLRDWLFLARPGERRRLQALVARNEAFVESVLSVTGKRIFVDTSKDRLRLSMLRRFSRLDLRAIHLVRDVRGVVASRLRREAAIDAREAARQWARLHRRLQAVVNTLPAEKRISIRYEDLCRDVRGTLDRLYSFCGALPDAAPMVSAAAEQHIIGNPMRLEAQQEIRLDERWRSLLTDDQLQAIQSVAGWLTRRYGYS